MAKIKPFMGLRFNPQKVGNLASVVTPPYDVIDETAQNKFYETNPYNIIQLELGKKYPDDNESQNVYTRAAATFAEWCCQEVLVKEAAPAFYLYQQEYQVHGENKVRTGFICTIKAEDYTKGQVMPHEETLPKRKKDRLELMRATEANFSPIFGLYSDESRIIDKALLAAVGERKPDIDITDWAGEKHRVWVVSDPETINTVVRTMDKLKIYIADGHHRYETAAAYGQEMKYKGKRDFDYMLITLVNLFDEGLVVLPTHRLVKNVRNFDFAKFLSNVESSFQVIPISTADSKKEMLNKLLEEMAEAGNSSHAFGLYGGKNMYLLKLRDDHDIEKMTDKTKSPAWRHLDVTILHSLILEKLLGIGAKERASEEFLKYTREDLAAIEAVDRGDCQIALLMNPTKVQEVTAVAEAGEKMPQKSTFFYPKVISGLVINKLG
jgi:uncharacterized protein (DUF1015 family)